MTARWWIATARAVLIAGAIVRSPAALAQEPAVSVKRQGVERVTVESGALATLAFLVANRSAAEQAVRGRLELPPEWRLVIPEPQASLPPHGSDLRLLRIALPSHAAAGQYVLRYGIAGTSATDSVLVIVPGRREVTVQLREAPRFITAGQSYDVLFEVRNAGNAPTVVRLAASASDGFPLRLDSGVVHLAAGREQLVRAHVQSDERVPRLLSNRVRLAATVEDDTARIEPAVSVVEVVPRHAERASRFRRLPAQLTVRQVDRAARPTLELRGGGALTTGGATKAEYLFRGLDQTASLFGEQDEYWLSLAAPHYRLLVGDRAAPYSRLGESWRSGFGADGQVTLGGVSIGGFSQRDRRSAAVVHDAEHGASVGVRPFDRLLAEARYLSRSGTSAGDVWTAHGQLTTWRAAAIDAELGRGRASTGSGGAYAVALTGSFPRGSYSLRRLAADSGFPGLTRGTSSSEATATVVPVRRLSMSVSATDWTALRTGVLTNPSTTGQRAVDGRVAWGQWLEAGYRWSTDSKLVVGERRLRRSSAARLYVGLPLGLATIRSGIEQGLSTFDDAPSERIPFRRLSIRGNVGQGLNFLAASVEWLSGTPVTSWLPDDHVRAALSVGTRLTPSTRLSTSVSATSYRGDRPRTPIVLDVAVVQSLPFGQRASWRTRAISYGPGVPAIRPTHQADYVVPFGLPVGTSDASGAVHARLLDRETGRPLAGVLLRIGDQVRFTDAQGAVSFDGLTEAKQYLEVDRSTLGADRVVVPAVVAIAVHPGETKELELGAARGAGVHGRVRRFDAETSDSLGVPQTLVEGGTIEGIVLQLSNGPDTLRASVDGWGRFSFGQVAPGPWTLSVVQADLPRYHRFEQDRMPLDLQPGSTREILLRVMPSAPPIQLIARAELTLEPSNPSRGNSPPAPTVRTADRTAGQWSPGKRRIVPLPADPDSIALEPRGDDMHTPPWQPGLRRDVAPPLWQPGRRRDVPPPSGMRDAPRIAAAASTATKHHYTVTKGDVSLVHVARVMYGDASLWPKIWLANLDQVRDPDVIHPGQRLRIPDKAPLTADEKAAEVQYNARRGAATRRVTVPVP